MGCRQPRRPTCRDRLRHRGRRPQRRLVGKLRRTPLRLASEGTTSHAQPHGFGLLDLQGLLHPAAARKPYSLRQPKGSVPTRRNAQGELLRLPKLLVRKAHAPHLRTLVAREVGSRRRGERNPSLLERRRGGAVCERNLCGKAETQPAGLSGTRLPLAGAAKTGQQHRSSPLQAPHRRDYV